MSDSSTSVSRPTTVTIAIVIGWLSVIVDVVGAVALLVLSNNDKVLDRLDASSDTATAIAIAALVTAAVLALVVFNLGKGSNVARTLVSIVMVLRIGVSVWAIIALGSHHLGEAVITMVFACFALYLLWNAKANEFFRSH